MGIGKSELTLAQLAAYRYQNVNFVNVPGGDLLYTVAGHPNLVIINLGEFLNISSGEIQGDAVAIDELTATQIAPGAVDTSELATGALAASAAGRGKMAAGYFDAATALTHIASSALVGSLIANDAVGLFEDITPTNVAFGGGATQEILAANATDNRHVLVLAIATVTSESGVSDWDIGVTAGNEVFDDILDGDWVAGERVFGACDLPAGAALNVTLQTAGSQGAIDFYVIPLTPTIATGNIADGSVTGLKLASVGSLFDADSAAVTVLERDYSDGDAQTILAANGAAAGDRLILVQAHVTELFALTSYNWDVGSATDPNGLFDDLFAGLATIDLRESEMSAYILPAGEALVLTEVEQTDGGGPAGKVTFRILDMGAVVTDSIADAAVTGVKLADEGVNFPDAITPTNVAFGGGGTQELLAADATQDRIVLVTAIVTVSAEAGVCDWDVGAVAGNEVFSNLAAGNWEAGDRYVGAMLLLQDEALNVTLQTAGSVGAIDFYVTELAITVRTAQLYADAVTDDKIASQIVKDEGARATGLLRVTGVIVDAEGIVIGADAYAADQIDNASGDTCKNGEWNNTDNPVTIDMNSTDYSTIGVGAGSALVLGELVYIETEYMRVYAINGDNVTFERGACGSTAANHVDTTGIFNSAGTEAPAKIPVGHQGGGDLAAGVMTPLIVGSINETNIPTEAVSAIDIAGDGSELLIVADAVGVVTLALTEDHGNAVLDDANMRRGAAAAVRQTFSVVITPDGEESTADLLYVPVPFVPTVVFVNVLVAASGLRKAWVGEVEVKAAAGSTPTILEFNNAGAVNWDDSDEIHILCVS